MIGAGDPSRAIAVRFIRAGFSCRSRARQKIFCLVIVGTGSEIPRTTGLPFPADALGRKAVFLIDAKDKLKTGLVHAETV